MELLATERLSLRQLEVGDAPIVCAYRSDPDVARHQSWSAPYPLRAAEALVQEMLHRRPSDPGWTQIGIELKATGELIGDVAFERRDAREAAVGYTLAPAHWGNGYATEAVGAVVDHGLDVLGHGVIVAEVLPENAASIGVLTRLGFERDGTTATGEDRYVKRRV
ncbi:MAG: GNAT family N-acetyltransferase [Acidimicrobiia bacterium]|nr:GNAT family N-acetyltransferase [Acidimicrobiia bacterium]